MKTSLVYTILTLLSSCTNPDSSVDGSLDGTVTCDTCRELGVPGLADLSAIAHDLLLPDLAEPDLEPPADLSHPDLRPLPPDQAWTDMAAVCGNGRCEYGEDQTNCCVDCKCTSGFVCSGPPRCSIYPRCACVAQFGCSSAEVDLNQGRGTYPGILATINTPNGGTYLTNLWNCCGGHLPLGSTCGSSVPNACQTAQAKCSMDAP